LSGGSYEVGGEPWKRSILAGVGVKSIAWKKKSSSEGFRIVSLPLGKKQGG